MAQLTGSPLIIVIVVAVVVVSVALRVYFLQRHGKMRAKCPNCSAVFEAARSFSLVHVGPLKRLKCPKCGKVSFMKTYVKDPLTWPPEKQESQPEQKPSEEELERKRIEDSKYQKQ